MWTCLLIQSYFFYLFFTEKQVPLERMSKQKYATELLYMKLFLAQVHES